jgi:hypothetical protein
MFAFRCALEPLRRAGMRRSRPEDALPGSRERYFPMKLTVVVPGTRTLE